MPRKVQHCGRVFMQACIARVAVCEVGGLECPPLFDRAQRRRLWSALVPRGRVGRGVSEEPAPRPRVLSHGYDSSAHSMGEEGDLKGHACPRKSSLNDKQACWRAACIMHRWAILGNCKVHGGLPQCQHGADSLAISFQTCWC